MSQEGNIEKISIDEEVNNNSSDNPDFNSKESLLINEDSDFERKDSNITNINTFRTLTSSCSINSLNLEAPVLLEDNEVGVFNEKTFMKRYFSKMKEGSFRYALLSLCTFALGSATFSIPGKFYNVSLIIGVIILIFVAIISRFSMGLLIYMSEYYRISKYYTLVRKIVGKKIAGVLNLLIIIGSFFGMALYMVIIYQTTKRLSLDIVYRNDPFADTTNSIINQLQFRAIVIYSVAFMLISVTVCFPNFHKLTFIPFFCLFTMAANVLIILIQSYWYIPYYWENTYKENDKNTWLEFFDFSKGFTKDLFFFRSFANFFFCYNFHSGVLPETSSLKKNDLKRKRRIMDRSILWYTSIYVLVGVIGYLSFPINTPHLITQRQKIFETDLILNIGKSLIIISLLLKISINFNSYKVHIFSSFFSEADASKKSKNLTAIVSVFLAATIAMNYSDIQNYFDFVGGLCSINICITIPCLCYLMSKSNKNPTFHYKRIFVLILLVLMLAVSFISTTTVIYTIIFKYVEVDE